MPDLVNVGDAVDVYAPSRSSDSLPVETGQTITVPGELAAEQPDDAYLIGEGDDARLWPHSRWQLATPPAQAETPATTPVTADAGGAGQSEES